ncbi:urocanate hydratase-like [Tubulanus polymorphus]|uniref:urocanate hydratase-like n=1 Tax=Tubulanus polymorphus TaxID=672921 RepID=UPI003DA4152F
MSPNRVEMSRLKQLSVGLPLNPMPDNKPRDTSIPHAPVRTPGLNCHQRKIALQNALRYFPPSLHDVLAAEFAAELRDYGHIYMYRFIPDFPMKAHAIDEYPARCRQAAAVMLMIMNNLDHKVAQFPHELVTYGGNGQVFSNWAQFWLTMKYLSEMTEEQTLIMCSGHPQGLFPSHVGSPRVVITNGMVIPNYSSREDYDKMFAMGVTMYGQMTAGSYCYIGPQGIVHGTTLTVLNAGRKKTADGELAGKVFVTAGLGGMSGAQPKAAVICRCVGVIAEVSEDALNKRYDQGWLLENTNDLDDLIKRIRRCRRDKSPISIGYHGNVVDVWEKLVKVHEETGELLVELGSDQTSCHNPFQGGYFPVQLSYKESLEMMHKDPEKFKSLVQESLRRQVSAINYLADKGMFFWDYGNAFLLEAARAGADVRNEGQTEKDFRYPSYMQAFMGDIFSMGFGPFRWVCASGDPHDLETTDTIACEVLEKIVMDGVPDCVRHQYEDNIRWIKEAGRHEMVVGSQARILYSDQVGRVALSVAFNDAISTGRIKGPVILSRDHHDVSGTDSPFRETSDITDGSAFCADMAVQNCIGDSFRGATWVALHNGGGCGWGEVINGGFGLVLDGSQAAGKRAEMMLNWDVANGVARRSWSGNRFAQDAIRRTMKADDRLKVTVPYEVEDSAILDSALLDAQ